jgi:hypothetical protein
VSSEGELVWKMCLLKRFLIGEASTREEKEEDELPGSIDPGVLPKKDL